MPLTKEETFYIEEYKSLREEIISKLKERLEFNRWGVIGLAALYSYILSHPKPILFWVPVGFSIAMIFYYVGSTKSLFGIANYIREGLEPWLGRPAGVPTPGGWETRLGQPGRKLWLWLPLPFWYMILLLALILTYVAYNKPELLP